MIFAFLCSSDSYYLSFLQMLPSGDWHCPNCTCKFCGLASGNMAEENDIGCDELNRCNFCEKKCNFFLLCWSSQSISLSLLKLCFLLYLCLSFFYIYLHADHKSCSERAHEQPTSSYSASFCGLKCQEVFNYVSFWRSITRFMTK